MSATLTLRSTSKSSLALGPCGLYPLVAVLHSRQYKAEFATSLFLVHVAMVLQVMEHFSSTNMHHDQVECFLCLDHLK